MRNTLPRRLVLSCAAKSSAAVPYGAPIAPYKYPRIIDFVDALPKTVNGKIRRAAIRDNDAGNTEE
jgi:acyl-coenzyme A synthetase/AMP-(fatty) acid ligase